MMQQRRSRSTRYHIFMLSLWEASSSVPDEPMAWRYSLEHGPSGARRGFRSLAEMMAYLERWTQEAPDDPSLASRPERDAGGLF
jgi:hypothetical protein